MVKQGQFVVVAGQVAQVRSTDGSTWAHVRMPNGFSRTVKQWDDTCCPHCGDVDPAVGGRCQTCGEDA